MKPMTAEEFRAWLESAASQSPEARAYWELLRAERLTVEQVGMEMARWLLAQNRGLQNRLLELSMRLPPEPILPIA